MTQLMERAAPETTAAQETVPFSRKSIAADVRTVNPRAGERRGSRAQRRRRNKFTLREAGITAALSAAWGALLWLFIGGAVELFGNPGVAP
jgi:hypothetical protein